MHETIPPSRLTFAEAFDAIQSAITPYPRRTWVTLLPDADHTDSWDAQVYELVAIDDGRRCLTDLTDPRALTMTGVHTYHTWRLTEPDKRTERTHVYSYVTGTGLRSPRSAKTVTELTMPWLCRSFAYRAATPEQLAVVAQRFAEWLPQVSKSDLPQLGSTFDQIIKKGIILDALDESDTSALRPFLALQENNADLRTLTNAHLGTRLGVLLAMDLAAPTTQTPIGFYTLEADVIRHRLVKAAELFDALGLINDQTWLRYGLRATIVCPGVLPLVYKKLSQDNTPMLLSEGPPERTTHVYIRELLLRYAQDPMRHRQNARNILAHTAPTKHLEGGVDIVKLIDLANGVTATINKNRTRESGAVDSLPASLNPVHDADISDALARLLFITQHPDAPESVRAKQFEQDMYYAEVVGLLHEQYTDTQRQRSLGAVALQYPNITGEQMGHIHELVRQGMPVNEAAQLVISRSA